MPSMHHDVLLRSSPLWELFAQGSVKDYFSGKVRNIAFRGGDDDNTTSEEWREMVETDVESWLAMYRQNRLVPDAFFVLDVSDDHYKAARMYLEDVTGPINLSPVNLFVCIEADLSSALSNEKLSKYAEWWMWFDCSEDMHLVVICIDRYGKHAMLDNNLLLQAYLANASEAARNHRNNGLQEAVEAD